MSLSTDGLPNSIAPGELHALIVHGNDVDLIDVRTPAKYDAIHAVGAVLAPLESLDPKKLIAQRANSAIEPIYVICRSGSRIASARTKIRDAGYPAVVNVAGGTLAWEQAGLPVIRGRRAVMSLERQVRICAGCVVVTGSMLGFFVHPAWIFLSAFIGAGLVFSGLTDTCGMGMVLAKMPWNQKRPS